MLPLFDFVPDSLVPFLFVFVDYCIAVCIQNIAVYKNEIQAKEAWADFIEVAGDEDSDTLDAEISSEDEQVQLKVKQSEHGDVSKPIDYLMDPRDVALIYLMNPYSIISCLACSTQVFSNLFTSLAILLSSRGKSVGAMLALSTSSYLSLYPVVLLPSIIGILSQSSKRPVSGSYAGCLRHYSFLTDICAVPMLMALRVIFSPRKLEFPRINIWCHVTL